MVLSEDRVRGGLTKQSYCSKQAGFHWGTQRRNNGPFHPTSSHQCGTSPRHTDMDSLMRQPAQAAGEGSSGSKVRQ